MSDRQHQLKTKWSMTRPWFVPDFFDELFPRKFFSHEDYWRSKDGTTRYTEGLEVIGAGFGRTGTASLQRALEILYNAPCYHGYENILRDDFNFWTRAMCGENVNYRDVFTGFAATCDYPACRLWKEIANQYPEAKVILTVRDPDKWADSVLDTVFTHLYGSPTMSWGSWVMFSFHPFWRRFAQMHSMNCDRGLLDGDFSKAHVKYTFERWNASVVASCPSDKLLVFDVSSGWEPLCSFLGKPVPDVPFPKMNEGANYRITVVERMDHAGYFVLAVAAVSAGVMIWSVTSVGVWLPLKS